MYRNLSVLLLLLDPDVYCVVVLHAWVSESFVDLDVQGTVLQDGMDVVASGINPCPSWRRKGIRYAEELPHGWLVCGCCCVVVSFFGKRSSCGSMIL